MAAALLTSKPLLALEEAGYPQCSLVPKTSSSSANTARLIAIAIDSAEIPRTAQSHTSYDLVSAPGSQGACALAFLGVSAYK